MENGKRSLAGSTFLKICMKTKNRKEIRGPQQQCLEAKKTFIFGISRSSSGKCDISAEPPASIVTPASSSWWNKFDVISEESEAELSDTTVPPHR